MKGLAMKFHLHPIRIAAGLIEREFTLLTCLLILLWSIVTAHPATSTDINFATILPRDVGQDFVIKKLVQDWNKASKNAFVLHQSLGGPKDGEAGIVRKLRAGNYHAALLSAVGLAEIDPDSTALQVMPLAFRSWAEVDFVRERLSARLESGLRAKGFRILFWADAGWVNFFSVREAGTPSDLKAMKMFVWAGHEKQVQLMKELGYHPVALETDSILTGFGTLGNRMIEAAPLPLGWALALRIQTPAPHVLAVNWVPIVGATIIREDVWNKIPADLRMELQRLCDLAGTEIRAEGRRFHDEALATLKKGPRTQVHEVAPGEFAEWQKLADEVGPKVRGNLVPAPIYDEVFSLLNEFRARREGK